MVNRTRSKEKKFATFVNSVKSTFKFKMFIDDNYDDMFNWWIEYFPFKPSELAKIRKVIEYNDTLPVSITKIGYITSRFREDNVPKIGSVEYYTILFDEEYALKNKEYRSNKVKGKNNPGYNHNGKFSKWSKNFKNDLLELKTKVSETKKANPQKANPQNVNTRIEYYLDKGLSIEESHIALSQRQSTFSLEKCIDNNGNKEGLKIWLTRQRNYMNTMNSKSIEEMKEINKRTLPKTEAAQLAITGVLEQEILSEIKVLFPNVNTQLALNYKYNPKKWKLYDFSYNKNIIEFNETITHADPRVFKYNSIVLGKHAEVLWDYDYLKNHSAISQGYNVKVMWELDYIDDPKKFIKDCVKFLSS